MMFQKTLKLKLYFLVAAAVKTNPQPRAESQRPNPFKYVAL